MTNIRIKIYISLVRTFLFLSFSALFLVSNTSAKESFSFGGSDDIQILSDKAYRKSADNSYEAHGNVIIKLKDDAIYGEKASVSLATGLGVVSGNVRYVGPQFTLYGTEIVYNLKTQKFQIQNAKLVNENFIILGRSIERSADGTFVAENAEYSTCKDCPESWSIQGLNVKVIPNQYIYMKHAFVKVKGVIVVYIPYIVLPIKTERETGLLFPRFGFDLERGFYFQQPFFWAISEDKDLTMSPTIYGQRSMGAELEYRQAINSNSDFSLFNMQAFDKIWEPGKTNEELTDSRHLRQFYDYSFYYMPGNRFATFVKGKFLSDLDIQSDYEPYLKNKLLDNEVGADYGVRTFWSFGSVGVNGKFKNNSYFTNAKGFDHSYVQKLASLDLATSPWNFLNELGPISKASFSFNLKGDYFKQNHVEENALVRNVQRLDIAPAFNIYFAQLGPINVKTEAKLDAQRYYLPTVDKDKSATKYGMRYVTNFDIEFEKTFSRAYIQTNEKVDVEKVSKDENLIGSFPVTGQGKTLNKVYHSSYKHLVKFGANHYYTSEQKIRGNEQFIDQISRETSEGRFDDRDILMGRNNVLYDVATRTDLPDANTVELSIGNSLVKKTPRSDIDPFKNFRFQSQNFDYTKVAYWNLSQGFLLNTKSFKYDDFDDRLTRFKTELGLNLGKFSFSGQEYYFHQSGQHVTSFNFNHNESNFNYKVSYIYDSFSDQRRYVTGDLNINLSDLLTFRTGHYYDFELSEVYESYVGWLYKPLNNCWQLDFEYRQKDKIRDNDRIVDRIVGINFLLNYNSKNFNSVFGVEL
jgi:LPS-assembly protein